MKWLLDLGHDLRLAAKSLRRNPLLSALVVTGIAIGIAVSTTLSAAHHSLARDPIPSRSDVLRYVRLDSWDPARPYPGDEPDTIPTQITYRDMVEIMKSDIPTRRTGSFESALFVHPPDGSSDRPWLASIRACHADFFPMFDVPFAHGAAWTREDDAARRQVVVLSAPANDRLFAGRDSVGRTVRLGDHDFTVIGVLAPWRPTIRVYDLTHEVVQPPESMFVPFDLLEPAGLPGVGNNDGWGPSPGPGLAARLASENCWIQYWVELPDAASRQAYADFLDAYALGQRAIGRFQQPLDTRLTSVPELMREWKVVPKELTALLVVSILFLVVSALNLMGLLLGKFLARAPEVGVRRALGASRAAIFRQHLVECELVALVGGAVGVSLAVLGVAAVNRLAPERDLFQLDLFTVALGVGLSLVAGLVAGAHPAWRICATAPAMHLKLQ